MKKIILLIFFGVVSGCSSKSDKVILFTHTQHSEIQSDYDYHLQNVKEYLDEKNIGYQISNSRIIRIDNQDEIKIEEGKQFAMILISQEKEMEIDYQFGTDVDLILKINEYFEIE